MYVIEYKPDEYEFKISYHRYDKRSNSYCYKLSWRKKRFFNLFNFWQRMLSVSFWLSNLEPYYNTKDYTREQAESIALKYKNDPYLLFQDIQNTEKYFNDSMKKYKQMKKEDKKKFKKTII